MYPVPGNYENNWNGYQTGLDVKDLLMDAENFDFKPNSNSVLIDSGTTNSNLSIEYLEKILK